MAKIQSNDRFGIIFFRHVCLCIIVHFHFLAILHADNDFLQQDTGTGCCHAINETEICPRFTPLSQRLLMLISVK
jgi:hypothetical protein